MPVYLRKLASASALCASSWWAWILSAISLASVASTRSPLSVTAQRRLIRADGSGKTHDECVGRQLVADRGLGDGGQGRDQRRQVVQVEVVADVDDDPQFGRALRRGGAGAQQRRMVAAPEGCGVGTGVDLDSVGPGIVHRGN